MHFGIRLVIAPGNTFQWRTLAEHRVTLEHRAAICSESSVHQLSAPRSFVQRVEQPAAPLRLLGSLTASLLDAR